MIPDTQALPVIQPASSLLRAEAITARYPDRQVLCGADLDIRAGSRVALLGANGSGKTTLLSCLSGAHRPTSGSVWFADQALKHDRTSLRAHRRVVQLVGQDPDDQLFSADVGQDVSFGPLNLGLDHETARVRVTETLALLSISQLADRPTHQLSYGERKRVAIAGAVAMRPEVLLLDEPTAGLDPAGVAELLAILVSLDTTVVLATHDVDLALTWADRFAVVHDGQVTSGEADLLADQDLLTRARLRMPWQFEVATKLGLPLHPTPRTADDVLERLRSAHPGPLDEGAGGFEAGERAQGFGGLDGNT